MADFFGRLAARLLGADPDVIRPDLPSRFAPAPEILTRPAPQRVAERSDRVAIGPPAGRDERDGAGRGAPGRSVAATPPPDIESVAPLPGPTAADGSPAHAEATRPSGAGQRRPGGAPAAAAPPQPSVAEPGPGRGHAVPPIGPRPPSAPPTEPLTSAPSVAGLSRQGNGERIGSDRTNPFPAIEGERAWPGAGRAEPPARRSGPSDEARTKPGHVEPRSDDRPSADRGAAVSFAGTDPGRPESAGGRPTHAGGAPARAADRAGGADPAAVPPPRHPAADRPPAADPPAGPAPSNRPTASNRTTASNRHAVARGTGPAAAQGAGRPAAAQGAGRSGPTLGGPAPTDLPAAAQPTTVVRRSATARDAPPARPPEGEGSATAPPGPADRTPPRPRALVGRRCRIPAADNGRWRRRGHGRDRGGRGGGRPGRCRG